MKDRNILVCDGKTQIIVVLRAYNARKTTRRNEIF